MQSLSTRQTGLFGYLLLLTALFAGCEISFFIQCSTVYLGEFSYISKHLPIPHIILPGVLYYLSIQILLHMAFTILVWLVARLGAIAYGLSWAKTQTFGFWLWLIFLLTILLTNQVFYPWSKFTLLTQNFFPHTVEKVILAVLWLITILAVGLALIGLIKISIPKIKRVLFSVFFLIVASGFIGEPQGATLDAATVERPNIIIIGIDSLRPNVLSFLGSDNATPHIDSFLQKATVFTDAMTPLARTFPAWVSLLTGNYPKRNGVRFNLADVTNLNLTETLPAILQKNGYETIFGMDETRFSNIDNHFGFDHVVSPPMGFNDFLVGEVNDFPFSNLLVNSPLGKRLFPYSFANRPVYVTYEPNTYLTLLEPILKKARVKPLFLAIHFCLPHFPYLWGHFHTPSHSALVHYLAAVRRADQQVSDFMALLNKYHLLEHSIVIMLSDHGEALELHGDRITNPDLYVPAAKKLQTTLPRFYPPSTDKEAVDQSAGHGTDVLGLTQYHSLLAFKFYGLANYPHAVIPGIVSLMDIKPTLLSLLKIPYHAVDGHSLLAIIRQPQRKRMPNIDFFLESDFSPTAVRSVHPETRALLFEGIDFFQISPQTARLTVRDTMRQLIISSKQYADIYGTWMLALYPQTTHTMLPVLVNLQSGKWTLEMQTDFAKQSPYSHMMAALKKFYGTDITHVVEQR